MLCTTSVGEEKKSFFGVMYHITPRPDLPFAVYTLLDTSPLSFFARNSRAQKMEEKRSALSTKKKKDAARESVCVYNNR